MKGYIEWPVRVCVYICYILAVMSLFLTIVPVVK